MDTKRAVLAASVIVYGGSTMAAAHSWNEFHGKLNETGKMLEVVFATSSQSINAAGFHVIQSAGQAGITHYVQQIAQAHVMRNGAATTSFINITSLSVS